MSVDTFYDRVSGIEFVASVQQASTFCRKFSSKPSEVNYGRCKLKMASRFSIINYSITRRNMERLRYSVSINSPAINFREDCDNLIPVLLNRRVKRCYARPWGMNSAIVFVFCQFVKNIPRCMRGHSAVFFLPSRKQTNCLYCEYSSIVNKALFLRHAFLRLGTPFLLLFSPS